MNCEIIDKLISAYIDRELKGDLEPKVRYHLAYCERCFRTYVHMKNTKELLSSLKSQELPDGFWKETRARLRPQAMRPAAVSKRRSSRLWTALAAAACLLLTASIVSLAPDPPLEIRRYAGESEGRITAALPEVNSTIDQDSPVGFKSVSGYAVYGYEDSARVPANAMAAEIFRGRGSSGLGALDLSRILRPDSLDLPERTNGTQADGENGAAASGQGRQGKETNSVSPTLVPAGWSGAP